MSVKAGRLSGKTVRELVYKEKCKVERQAGRQAEIRPAGKQ
jgi:hypothetical protein